MRILLKYLLNSYFYYVDSRRMEIISYVQGNPRPHKISFPARHHKEALTYSNFNTQLKTFTAQKVKNQISVRFIFAKLGHALTEVADILKTNSKKLLRGAIVLFISIAMFLVFLLV